MKNFIIETCIKKFVPSAIKVAIASIGTFIMARANWFSLFGITYDNVTHVLSVHLDTLQNYLIVGIPIAIHFAVNLGNHAGSEVIKNVQAPDAPKA